MKLISLNVALFEKNNQRLINFFKKENADILCLQEVARKIDQSVDKEWISLDAIDTATPNLTHAFFAPLLIVSDFETKNFHGHKLFKIALGGKVEYGNYLKTRFPLIKGENIFVQNSFSYRTDWSKWPKDDSRAIQFVNLQLNRKTLTVINYHGIWSQDKQDSRSAKKACEIIFTLATKIKNPTIICGDFNLYPDTASIQLFNKKFTNLVNLHRIRSTRLKNHPLNLRGRNVVDYIFTSPDIKLKKFAVMDIDISDHLPLMIDFEI